MARQANDGRRVRPDQKQSIGAALLDRPVHDAQQTQTKHLLQEEMLRVSTALQQGRLAERARADVFEASLPGLTRQPIFTKRMDARVKPAHDDLSMRRHLLLRRAR